MDGHEPPPSLRRSPSSRCCSRRAAPAPRSAAPATRASAGTHASRSSSATAAPAGTGPSTRAPPTSWRSRWAPTTSSPTSSPPRATSGLPAIRPANTAFDGLYQIPTLQEVIDLAKRHHVGIYPETKHPTYFRGIGLPLEESLVATLRANGYRGPNAKVFIQSFEVGNLKRLDRMTDVPLVQLIDEVGKPYDFVVSGDPRTYADLIKPAGLAEIAGYADGIGPSKNLIVPRDAQNRLTHPTTLIRDAHKAGLVVHPWTFRRENNFLPEDFRQGNPASPVYLQATGDFPAELRLFYKLGVDGVFSDNSDVAVAVRHQVFG